MDAIKSYLATLPSDEQAALRRITDKVRALAPNAEAKIYYGVPSFVIGKKLVLGIACGKKFMSLYPTGEGVDIVRDDLTGYSLSRGTIRFTLAQPLPEPVVDKLIRTRLAQIQAQA